MCQVNGVRVVTKTNVLNPLQTITFHVQTALDRFVITPQSQVAVRYIVRYENLSYTSLNITQQTPEPLIGILLLKKDEAIDAYDIAFLLNEIDVEAS
jgi:hypothetical protein